MRLKFAIAVLATALLMAGCAGGGSKVAELEANNAALAKRVQKLEDDLHEAKRQLIVHEQALKTVSERLRSAESNIDKLAYRSATTR